MSVREGTRRKKISMQHMLGAWEGKIDGCNCPSCKEWDAGVRNLTLCKSPPKGSKKFSIKVKTTRVLVEKQKEVGGEKASPVGGGTTVAVARKQEDLSKDATEKGQSSRQEIEDGVVKEGNYYQEENEGDGVKAECEEPEPDTRKGIFNVEQFERGKEDDDTAANEREDIRKVPEEEAGKQKEKAEKHEKLAPNSKAKSGESWKAETDFVDAMNVKEEPEDYFSDFEEVSPPGKLWERTLADSRASKRARLVTSEMENTYAKPRMIFTGRGVVRKFEPGLDRTPKSRRGRKGGRIYGPPMPLKVKQEPKEREAAEAGEEETDIDQLQRALSEAAESISDVGEEFMGAFPDFNVEDDRKRAKKKPAAMFKRVEGEAGDRYVECSICFKMLKDSSMKQHYKTHTGEKPHSCSECDSRFTRKGDVERHKRLVHKNQKPFKCQKCYREFSDRKNLKAHLQNHDKAIYYACGTCNFKFGKREYYENHIRYIHPLPDGSVPNFLAVDEDLATKQLKEIEMEEKQEQSRGRTSTTGSIPINKADFHHSEEIEADEEEEDDDREEDDKAMEITVTEGEEEGIFPDRGMTIKAEVEEMVDEEETSIENLENIRAEQNDITKSHEKSGVSGAPPRKSQVGTDIRVSKGTLSFTQTVPDTDSQDEDLVNKVIAAAVSQATSTIESLQTRLGGNMLGSGNELEDEEEEEMMEDPDDVQILDPSYEVLPMPKQPALPSEVHINASVGGQPRKFIIQVPPGSNLNFQSPDGMEMIVNIVNQLCAGKGELDGPIEVLCKGTPNSEEKLVTDKR